MGRTKTLAQQIAELDEPVANDYDPEEHNAPIDSDEESGSGSDDELNGTEHYVDVGKSKLRKQPEVALGPKYVGSRISREALLHDDSDESPEGDESEGEEDVSGDEDVVDPDTVDMDAEDEDGEIDSDEALGESDDEKFKDFAFRGSGKPKHGKSGKKTRMTAADFLSDSEAEEQAANGVEGSEDDEDEDMDDEEDDDEEGAELGSDDDETGDEDDEDDQEEEDEDDEDENEESSSDEDEDGDNESSRRAELRKMMSEEQKSVVATISQAAKADADKGNAVKQQRKAFDGLLNVRIRLQKALVATNSMSAADESTDGNEPYQAAEEAAIKLWNTLDGLRHELAKAGNSSKTGQKRKRAIDADTASSKIWERMQDMEVATLDNRQTTLEKWSSKVRGATALPSKGKLNNTAAQHTITDVLQEQLSNSERLVKRTKMPRSCAPVQAKAKLVEDPDIFDDADFYQLLLKELVDQRMMDSASTPGASGDGGRPMQWTAVKEAKTKKNVDTKASKGRKMRFTIHEKLQNFMAPEDRNAWEQDAVDRFFGTLLGQKMNLGEEDEQMSDVDDAPLEEEGLMLFRS